MTNSEEESFLKCTRREADRERVSTGVSLVPECLQHNYFSDDSSSVTINYYNDK